MKITEISKQKNEIIPREEIVILLNHKGASQPKRSEVKEAIAAKYDLKIEGVIVQKIKPLFGRSESQVTIHHYKKVEDVKKYVPKHLQKRNAAPKKEEAETPEPVAAKTEGSE